MLPEDGDELRRNWYEPDLLRRPSGVDRGALSKTYRAYSAVCNMAGRTTHWKERTSRAERTASSTVAPVPVESSEVESETAAAAIMEAKRSRTSRLVDSSRPRSCP